MAPNTSKSMELEQILQQHRMWLDSAKQDGRRADLTGAQLDGTDFSGANLDGAIMRGASLRRANLSNAQLVHADLSDANLSAADLRGANLLLTDFTGADLREANISDTVSNVTAVSGQMRRGPRFKDADLQGADLTRSYCYISDFSGANLAGTDFCGAMLERANLSHNDLSGAVLRDANLYQTNLQDSELSEASFCRANLMDANLQRANLSGADVSMANLKSANLAEAKVDGIRYDRKTQFRGIRVSSCYGSTRFRRFAQDQDFIEEFKQAHRFYYYVWLGLTDCGRSMLRVVLWSMGFALSFGVIFYLLGDSAFAISNADGLNWNLFTSLYYSVVTFTTLGFGDITPRTPLAAGFVMVEVVVGYLMLGILISILATKVARRS